MGSNQPPPPRDDEPDESAAEPSASSSSDADDVDARPPTLPYATPTRAPKLKTIRQLSSFEANLAAAKLQAAGITAFVIDDNISTAYPLVFASVRLQVPEDEVERAESVLSEPAVESAGLEGDDDEDALRARSLEGADAAGESDYVDEPYRCPKCHRKDVELLPLSGVMRHVRFGCLTVLLLPVLVGIATWLLQSRSDAKSPDLFAPEAVFAWMAVLGILSFVVLTAKRRKRCRTCGHEWIG
jgi:hypothetical protein